MRIHIGRHTYNVSEKNESAARREALRLCKLLHPGDYAKLGLEENPEGDSVKVCST